MFCMYCSKEINDDAKFCACCGREQTLNASAPNNELKSIPTSEKAANNKKQHNEAVTAMVWSIVSAAVFLFVHWIAGFILACVSKGMVKKYVKKYGSVDNGYIRAAQIIATIAFVWGLVLLIVEGVAIVGAIISFVVGLLVSILSFVFSLVLGGVGIVTALLEFGDEIFTFFGSDTMTYIIDILETFI